MTINNSRYQVVILKMRKYQNTNTFLTLVDLLSSGSSLMSEEMLESFVVGFALGRISNICKAQEILKVSKLIQQVNMAYNDQTISQQSRINILLKVTGVNYDNYDVFERSLIRYVQEESEETQNKRKYTQKVEEHNCQPISYQQIESRRNLQQQKLSQQYISKLISMQQNKQRERRKQELQSQKYAKQIANKYQKALQDQKKKIQNQQTNCQICLENILIKDLACLKCSDSYHRQCLSKHFQVFIESRNLPLRCPSCSKQCCLTDIRQYLDDVIFQKYQQITFQNFVDSNNKDMSWCPTPGCQYIFFFEGQQTKFDCPICLKEYCLKCKTPFHKGMTCKQSSINNSKGDDHQKFIEFVQGAKYKQCSNCLFWVQKTQGCNHMTCRCKHQFCYNCGGKYKQCGCKKASLFGNAINNQPRQSLFGGPSLRIPVNPLYPAVRFAPAPNPPAPKLSSLFIPVDPPKPLKGLFSPIEPPLKPPTSLFGNSKPSNGLFSTHLPQKPQTGGLFSLPTLSTSNFSTSLIPDNPQRVFNFLQQSSSIFHSSNQPSSKGSLFS